MFKRAGTYACISRLAAVLIMLLAAPPSRAADPIKIGASIALTGPLASGGKVMLISLKLWEEDVNARGGLLGRPVSLVYYDDQSNGSLVPGIYAKLLDVDKVDLVISSYGTNVAAPAIPIVMQKNKLFISMFSIGLNTEFKYPRYFSMHPAGPNPKPGYSEGFFKVATQQSPKPQTVAIVTADGEATRLVTDGVYENVKKAGLQIVHDRRYPLNTTDFTPIVRAAQATRPDIFFISSYPVDSVGVLRSVSEVGFKPKIVGGILNGLPAPVLKAQLGPMLNGVINYEYWVPIPAMIGPGVMDLISRYQARARRRRRSDWHLRSALGLCAGANPGAVDRCHRQHRGRQACRLHAHRDVQDHDRRGEVRSRRRMGEGPDSDGAASRHHEQRHHAVQGHVHHDGPRSARIYHRQRHLSVRERKEVTGFFPHARAL